MEEKVIRNCCELNDKIIINTAEHENRYTYLSRFLSVDFKEGFIVIDEPSPETPDAKPISKGQTLEIFFQSKIHRYLFVTKVVDHTTFKFNFKSFHALKISMPGRLKDGDKREYFRIDTGMRPPIDVYFNIHKYGQSSPIMSIFAEDQPEEFIAEMVDVSGGGFSIRAKLGSAPPPLEKGDVINARFKLRDSTELLEIWSDVRNYRRYKETNIMIWGLRFLGREKNEHISNQRNKILRFVLDRQREKLQK